MKAMGASGHGPSWLIEVFERMGEDPGNASYVRPGDDDIWAFMYEIRKWLVDPKRKGIPL